MSLVEQVAHLRAYLAEHPELASDEVVRELGELDRLLERNPLQKFWPHPAQAPFFEAATPVIAAFAGNRFGKTTALTVRSVIECVDEECLPEHLRRFKRWGRETAPRGTFGRIVNPSFKLLEGVILDAFRQWCPVDQLLGGSFDKAYKGAPSYKLSFANGSFIEFMTHEQDLSKFGGSARHFIGYDEPPPADIRQECQFRTVDYDGYEMFACTPLKTNTAWLRRDIFKKRESPDITVIRGSIHDNPNLSAKAKERALADASDLWRRAREFGDFVEMGGLIYGDFERRVIPRPSGDLVRALEPIVGIDPGIRNAGIVFCGRDADGVLVMFDEALLQDKTPADYARAIRSGLKRWGINEEDCTFVVDPAMRQRDKTNAETVQSALMREGIYTVNGQNDVEAGIQQVRLRIQHDRLAVSEECRLTRDEADDYAAEDRDDGVFKPIKTDRMHLLDALRYVGMHWPYDPAVEDAAPEQMLGWRPGFAPPAEMLIGRQPTGPFGSLS